MGSANPSVLRSPYIVQEVANATLCVESARPGARVTVFNATNDVLQPADAVAAATTFASLAHGRWGIHRLDVLGPQDPRTLFEWPAVACAESAVPSRDASLLNIGCCQAATSGRPA